jgi:hypothetical protein
MEGVNGHHPLDALDVLVGNWSMEARPPGDSPWTGGSGRAGFQWLSGRRFLVQRWTIDVPEAPDGIAIIGPGEEAGSLRQHYFDSRGIHRIYEMSLIEGTWKLWRNASDPFPQRYTGTFSADRKTITGRWERAGSDSNWEIDFDLTYRRLE